MDKKVVLFGTGKYFDNFLDWCQYKTDILFAVDNDSKKQGKEFRGIRILPIEKLAEIDKSSFYVVICMSDTESALKQLNQMGITDVQKHYYIEIDSDMVEIEKLAEGNKKPYKIGYVPGVFDLFHQGHLQLLRKAKARCEYLIVGVLTDELVIHFKSIKPIIPYAQRASIVSAISFVDRVVPVDFQNTEKINAWKQLKFDCHFSGNDHGSDWDVDKKQLEEVGSKMEFFSYSKANSSTEIRNKITS